MKPPCFMLAVSKIPRIFCGRARHRGDVRRHERGWRRDALCSDWLPVNVYGSGGSGARQRCESSFRAASRPSPRWYVNMQSDDRVSCLKTDLVKSCGTFRVLVGVTGSVAALKLPLLVSQLLQLPGVSCLVLFTACFLMSVSVSLTSLTRDDLKIQTAVCVTRWLERLKGDLIEFYWGM